MRLESCIFSWNFFGLRKVKQGMQTKCNSSFQEESGLKVKMNARER